MSAPHIAITYTLVAPATMPASTVLPGPLSSATTIPCAISTASESSPLTALALALTATRAELNGTLTGFFQAMNPYEGEKEKKKKKKSADDDEEGTDDEDDE